MHSRRNSTPVGEPRLAPKQVTKSLEDPGEGARGSYLGRQDVGAPRYDPPKPPRRAFEHLHRACRPLGGVVLLVLGLLSLGLLTTASVMAQAEPPDRFYGTVTIDGKEQPVDTVVEGYVGSTLCGSGTVQNRNGAVIYFVDVLGAGQKPGCAKDGDTVTFKVAGLNAQEKGTYQTGTATRLDLTASGTPKQVATQTVLPAGGGGTPAPSPTIVTAAPVAATTGTPAPIVPPPAASPGVTGTALAPSTTSTAVAGATGTATASATATALAGSAASATATALAGSAASATPTAARSVTPAPAFATPSATPFSSLPGSEATVTATSHPAISAAPLIKTSKSSGPPAAVWAVIAVAALAAIGGIGAWFYRQRTAV